VTYQAELRAGSAARLTVPLLILHGRQVTCPWNLPRHSLGDAETYAWKCGK
jgi:hypothetical protein